jgi:hypothetical protein
MKYTDPLPKPTPAAFDLDNVAAVEAAVVYLIQSRCPDTKAQKKAFAVLNDAVKCATNPMMYLARDVLWDISGGFEELSDIASEKSADAPTYDETVKWYNRSEFFNMLATWASASLEPMEKALDKQQSSTVAPVDCVKDAEDDSDPYVKPTITTAPLHGPRQPNKEPAPYSLEWARAKLASDLRLGGFSVKQLDTALRIFDLEANDFLSGSVEVRDVLERFGDVCAQLSFDQDSLECEESKFFDACVMISDDLRAEITSYRLSSKANYTTSSPEPTPRNEVCHSSEPEDAGQMWEVCGDPHRALFYTKLHAEHWAREMFPTENPAKRNARVQYRTILKFPS